MHSVTSRNRPLGARDRDRSRDREKDKVVTLAASTASVNCVGGITKEAQDEAAKLYDTVKAEVEKPSIEDLAQAHAAGIATAQLPAEEASPSPPPGFVGEGAPPASTEGAAGGEPDADMEGAPELRPVIPTLGAAYAVSSLVAVQSAKERLGIS